MKKLSLSSFVMALALLSFSLTAGPKLAAQDNAAPTQSPSTQPDTQDQHPAATSFSGTIAKTGDKLVLQGTDHTTYMLDDQQQAKKYEGKMVTITGTVDTSNNTIHVASISPAS